MVGILCLYSVTGLSAELYKWTDKHGKTHYTQIKPSANPTANYQKYKPNSAPKRLEIAVRDDREYCGEHLLPGSIHNPLQTLEAIETALPKWKKTMSKLVLEYNSIVQQGSKRSLSKKKVYSIEKDMDKYNCFIRWALNRKYSPQMKKALISKKIKHARREYYLVRQRYNIECGEKPAPDYYENGYPDDEAYQWNTCDSDYSSQLKDSKKELDKLEQELKSRQ